MWGAGRGAIVARFLKLTTKNIPNHNHNVPNIKNTVELRAFSKLVKNIIKMVLAMSVLKFAKKNELVGTANSQWDPGAKNPRYAIVNVHKYIHIWCILKFITL